MGRRDGRDKRTVNIRGHGDKSYKHPCLIMGFPCSDWGKKKKKADTQSSGGQNVSERKGFLLSGKFP